MTTILAISISGYAIVQYMILGAGKSGFVMSKVNFGEVLNEVWYIMLYIHASSSLITLALRSLSLVSSNQKQKSKIT